MLLTMKRLNHLVAGFLCAVFSLLLAVPTAVAVSAQDFAPSLPDEVVLDSADVLSRASRNEISTRLQDLNQFHVDARLVTVRRLDYGLSLSGFGEELLDRWAGSAVNPALSTANPISPCQCSSVASSSRRSGLLAFFCS